MEQTTKATKGWCRNRFHPALRMFKYIWEVVAYGTLSIRSPHGLKHCYNFSIRINLVFPICGYDCELTMKNNGELENFNIRPSCIISTSIPICYTVTCDRYIFVVKCYGYRMYAIRFEFNTRSCIYNEIRCSNHKIK